MPQFKLLVIEDDEDIVELIRYNLAKEGYAVTCVASGEEGLRKARTLVPDLILLDLMLPGFDGIEVCKRLKRETGLDGIPIIMLTAKGEETDIVAGLEVGADDYITKPFAPKVLTARVRAVLRRKRIQSGEDDDAVLHVHEVEINPGRHEVLVGGDPVELTFTEFRILHFMARRPGWVFSRKQIVDAVRGYDYPVTERAVDVQIVAIRKKLGDAGRHIETVRGVGYRFRE